MKSFALVMMLAFSAVASEKAPSLVDLVSKNLEVSSYISAFEKNRNQTCDALTEQGVSITKSNKVTAHISCNEYDLEGMPMANVYFITIEGYSYGTSLEVQKISVVGAE